MVYVFGILMILVAFLFTVKIFGFVSALIVGLLLGICIGILIGLLITD